MKIVIKLSGEGLGEKDKKFSEEVIKSIADHIAILKEKDHQVALVVGGGNLFRGRALTGVLGITGATADYIGMLATVQNALVLRDYFQSRGIETRVASAITMPKVCEGYIPMRVQRHMEKGRVVIFAAGLGLPYFSTDSCAVQRALEMQADILVMAKNGVDGLYSDDPRKNKDAEFIQKVTASEVLEKNLKFADQSAVALAKENSLIIKVVSVDAISTSIDEGVGSTIEPK